MASAGVLAPLPVEEEIITTAELDEAAAKLAEESGSSRKGKRRAEDDDAPMDEDDDVERPNFKKLKNSDDWSGKADFRRITIPSHRLTPLKNSWMKIYVPLVEHMKLQVRMNLKAKAVEIRNSQHTEETGAVQKGADFVKAFALGFDVDDAVALLRLDDLYIDTFEIKDVKTLRGDNLSRAIGRIAGKDGKTRFAIENATRTRIVVADTRIHILGSFANIKLARDAVVDLIMGSPPGKVYSRLRTIGARLKERF
ncbi:pre-rRNA-processing protein PNO1 [Hyaloraphidium curvatum]|nr:pre-rRNA-processing protein PNO1 [Hyaloraphidium curvatum]